MPTYEYECRTCGYVFERVQNMSDDPVRDCPECGQAVRRNIFGGSGVIFKGSGFYVNDSRGKNPAAPAVTKSNSGDTATAAPASGSASSGTSASGNSASGSASAGAASAPSEQKKSAAPAAAGTSSQSSSKSSRE